MIRWSIQEVRRIAIRLAQRRINPAYVIPWSCWRRAPQAAARRAVSKQKCNCNAGADRFRPTSAALEAPAIFQRGSSQNISHCVFARGLSSKKVLIKHGPHQTWRIIRRRLAGIVLEK
ncbi:hypothetical protein AGR1_19895 [Agrobacterium sp. B1(2019)]|nr:hypothetical protein AGR1_19895 [Agrobacterium sp. B1(2019)]